MISKVYTLEEIEQMKSLSDLERIKRTTEKDILEQIIADPDTPNLTDEEIKEFRLVNEGPAHGKKK